MHERIFAFVVLILATTAWPAAAQTTLRLRFTPGETQRGLVSNVVESTIGDGAEGAKSKIVQQMEVATSVDGVDAQGNATVTQKLTRMAMSTEIPGPKGPSIVKYDSATFDAATADRQSAQLGKVLGPLIDAPFSMQISPVGGISKFQLPEARIEQIRALPGASAVSGMLSPDALQRMLGDGAMPLPPEPVRVGNSWKRDVEIEMPLGKMQSVITYTYAGSAANGLERLTIHSEVQLIPQEKLPLKITIRESQGSGEALFDNVRGRLQSSALNQSMKMTIEIAGKPIDQTVTTRVMYKLLPPVSR